MKLPFGTFVQCSSYTAPLQKQLNCWFPFNGTSIYINRSRVGGGGGGLEGRNGPIEQQNALNWQTGILCRSDAGF